ncbi:IS110 family transposase [Coleofasciculus sp. F4-SAH-05]|uniref:IS110 family transposase n=1 Tax=Coleofasciculus sp. F4-SAH-05 TaxID=3069525 RepID=UPI0032F150E8
MQRFVGVDICKDHFVCWTLEFRPQNLKQYWRENFKSRSRKPEDDELTFYVTSAGIDGFLSLRPTAIAMEPTGFYYSEFLARVCAAEGIPVYWVGHAEVNHYRRGHRLPDKNDLADALAMAAYLWENHDKPEFFLEFFPGPPRQLRELYLKLQTLNRQQNPYINRIRQQLAVEFPEVAMSQCKAGVTGVPPLIGWLANSENTPISAKARTDYAKRWNDSISRRYGGTISPYTRKLAQHLCDLYHWENQLQAQMNQVLMSDVFVQYRKILDRFGMKPRTQSIIISQIYPISRYDSIGGFKKRLGCAGEEESSGDKQGFRTTAGSKLLRQAMYLWVLTTIAPTRSRPQSAIGQKIGAYYDKQKNKLYGSQSELTDRAVSQKLKGFVGQLERMLRNELSPLVRKDGIESLHQALGVVVTMLNATLLGNLVEPISDSANETEIKKGFGNLVIMRTAGYSCKLLFKELKRNINQS